MSLKNILLKLLTYYPKRQFVKACMESQESFSLLWQETKDLLLQDNTFWAKKGYSLEASLENFPITKYQDYQAAMEKGAKEALSPFNLEEVDFCMTTSGTSGSMKPFLMTKSYKKQYQIIAAPFVHYMTSHTDYGNGKLLYLISLDSEGFGIESKAPVGTIGNYTYKHIPKYLKQLYVLPDSVLRSPDAFEKEAPYYAIANELSAFFSVTPAVAVNFLENILKNNLKGRIQSILDDEVDLELNCSQERKAYLAKLLKQDEIRVKDLWPKLKLFSCWTSSICQVALPRLRELSDNTPVADGIYSATEGWVCVQTDTQRRGSIYHPRGCILEFIPVEQEIKKEKLLKPWELQVGKRYEVFFTNKMGLIRYQIGDIVECTGYFYKSPVIQFVSKNSSSLSLGMMRLSEEELILSLADLDLGTQNFFFSTSLESNSLTLYIDTMVEGLEKKVEERLQEISLDYRKERQTNSIDALQVKILKESRFYNTHQTGQVKPKIIVNNYLADE